MKGKSINTMLLVSTTSLDKFSQTTTKNIISRKILSHPNITKYVYDPLGVLAIDFVVASLGFDTGPNVPGLRVCPCAIYL